MRGLCYIFAGAVRGPQRSRDLPPDPMYWNQGRQLHPRHPRCQGEICGARTISVRPPQKVW